MGLGAYAGRSPLRSCGPFYGVTRPPWGAASQSKVACSDRLPDLPRGVVETGGTVGPWADGDTNPHLAEWAGATDKRRDGAGKRALVVGCGLGYDAEFLAGLGYEVTAFDVAPTAIERAVRENPGSRVAYVTADLLALPADWAGAFAATRHLTEIGHRRIAIITGPEDMMVATALLPPRMSSCLPSRAGFAS